MNKCCKEAIECFEIMNNQRIEGLKAEINKNADDFTELGDSWSKAKGNVIREQVKLLDRWFPKKEKEEDE